MKKRRQHFVWRHYLEPWTVDGRIACWRRGRVSRTATRNIAVESYFYRLRDISDRDVSTIRRLISLFPSHLKDLHDDWLAIFTLPLRLRQAYQASGQIDPAFERQLEEAFVNLEEELHAAIERDAIPLLHSLQRCETGFFATEQGFSQFMHFLSVQYMRTRKTQIRYLSEEDDPLCSRQRVDDSSWHGSIGLQHQTVIVAGQHHAFAAES